MNPWPGQPFAVTADDREIAYALDAANGECITFETETGREYELTKL